MAQRRVSVSDAVTAKLNAIAAKLGRGSVDVGFLEGATYPDGTPVAEVAFFNTFGTSKSPPRPFFQQMVSAEEPTWPGKIAKLAKVTNYDGPKVLALMGEDMNGALKQSINALTTPELAPSTVARKGFDKPLIDSSHMVNSTDFEVHK